MLLLLLNLTYFNIDKVYRLKKNKKKFNTQNIYYLLRVNYFTNSFKIFQVKT